MLFFMAAIGDGGAVALFYHAVVSKEETSLTVVSMRRINPNLSYILIETYPHGVFDPSPFDAGIEAIADFSLIGRKQFSSLNQRNAPGKSVQLLHTY
ncbi:MAG TPA: hypothetical protein VG206_08765 [Terriglobia bacterium]|nr:hypothetical protein [Terriglobia bacterium]